MIHSLTIDGSYPDIETIRSLYDRSFPDDERIPFDRLLAQLNKERVLLVFLDEEELLGMAYLFYHRDLVYLGYLCILEEKRDQGYGSFILQKILKDHEEKRIVADIEEVKEDASDYPIRQKRKDFYLRNGFHSSAVFYRFYGVDYELVSAHGDISQQDWQGLIRRHWGRIAETAVYR